MTKLMLVKIALLGLLLAGAEPIWAMNTSFANFLKSNQREFYDANIQFASLHNPNTSDDMNDDTVNPFCETQQLSAGEKTEGDFYDVYKHTAQPIYFYKFSSKKYQDLTFDRISDFVEKDEKKLVTPEEHKYPKDDGTDIKGADIADFFNAMSDRGSELTAFEKRLKTSLLSSGNFKETEGGKVRATKDFVVVSSAVDSNSGTTEHELSHAVYFTDPTYRQKVIALYKSLTPAEKKISANILADVGGHTPEKGIETYYTEFGAYFRDPAVLYRDGAGDHAFTDKDKAVVEKVAKAMKAIEKHTKFFEGCKGKGNAVAAKRAAPTRRPTSDSTGSNSQGQR